MFETREEIRKAARTKFIAEQVEKAERRGRKEGIKEGQKIAMERFKAELREKGVELSPAQEQQLLANDDDRKWWQHLPPFRKS